MTILDASKIGYRWKGVYSPDSLYIAGDTVLKSGEVQFWTGDSWRTMATGQMDTKSKGEIAGYDKSPVTNEFFAGAVGQKFTVDSFGKPLWQYDDMSRTNAVAKLPTRKHGTGYQHDGINQSMYAIMTDGTLMGWGRNLNKELGAGNQGDISRSLPVQIQFYQDTDAIASVYGSRHQRFAITTSGQLYAWGHNNYGQLGVGNTTDQQRPRLVNGQGDLPLNAVVTDVYTVTSYYGYSSTMIMTADNLGYAMGRNANYNLGFNDGTGTGNQTTPKLIARTADVGCKKIFNGQQYYPASAFLGMDDRLYVLGEVSSSMSVFNANHGDIQHQVWAPSIDPGFTVKNVIWHESDDHSQTGSQYHRAGVVLSEEGDIWSYQTSVRRSNITYPADTHLNEWRYDPRIDNIEDVVISHGGYEHMIAMKKNGEIWTIGQNQYEVRGLDVDGSVIGSSNDWKRNYMAPNDNIKLTHGASRYGSSFQTLTASGYVFGSGQNERGHHGHGWVGAYGQDTDKIGDPVDDNFFVHNSELNRRTIARVPDRVVDIYTNGYVQDATTNCVTYYLTDKGELWSSGASNNGMLGWEDDNDNAYTPQRVML